MNIFDRNVKNLIREILSESKNSIANKTRQLLTEFDPTTSGGCGEHITSSERSWIPGTVPYWLRTSDYGYPPTIKDNSSKFEDDGKDWDPYHGTYEHPELDGGSSKNPERYINLNRYYKYFTTKVTKGKPWIIKSGTEYDAIINNILAPMINEIADEFETFVNIIEESYYFKSDSPEIKRVKRLLFDGYQVKNLKLFQKVLDVLDEYDIAEFDGFEDGLFSMEELDEFFGSLIDCLEWLKSEANKNRKTYGWE